MSDKGEPGTGRTAVDRPTPGRDRSRVPAQGGQVARRCPLRVRFDLMAPPEAPAPRSAVAQARIDEARAFEAAVLAELAAAHPTALRLGPDLAEDERVAATVQAMVGGVHLIVGARLPVDEAGRRTGTPPVLVGAGARPDGTSTYLPVVVKHHTTLAPLEHDGREPAVASELAHPSPAAARPDPARTVRSLRGDALELAHFHRMLEACGHAADRRWAGIIGRERRFVWIDLDTPRFRAPSTGETTRSALQHYDAEFAFRLDVVAAALDGDDLVEPVLVDECRSCQWYSHCGPRLVETDSVSLLPLHPYVRWRADRRPGVATRHELAGLDRRTALVRDALPEATDVAALVDRARRAAPATPVVELVGGEPEPSAALVAHGVTTAGDLLALDRKALSLHDRMVGGSLASAIDVARVAMYGQGALHRRRGVASVAVPAAHVEIDIDMESTLDGTTYLWGALVDGAYAPVVEWGPPSELLAARLFARFWRWVDRQRRTAHDRGQRIAFYCWSAGAERGALTSGAALAEAHLGAVGVREAVAAFVAGEEFVDLLQVVRTQLESGAGNGLKAIAPRAGFAWRDQEPSGEESMLWHRTAVAGTGHEAGAARLRLLHYNEDDVRATAAVRRWLRATTFPAVEDLDGLFDPSPVPR